MISDKKPVQDFVSLLCKHGIGHVIITPGSRNAPFIISLGEHDTIKAHSIIDERSAAFVALGMAQQLAHPVALICTSGTAALNFAPAIAEAFYQRVPLLVVTADRPIEWIDQGEGQSIRQKEVFKNYVKASFEIAEEANEGDLVWYNVRLMDEAMRCCTEGVHGPVHINFPLRESLYKTTDTFNSDVKIIERAATDLSLSASELQGLKQKIGLSKKVMVLAGQMGPNDSLLENLVAFAENENVVVMTEAHSNLSHPGFVTTIDRLIMGFDEEEKVLLIPDLLITVGHNIISRKIKEYLRSGQIEHWHVDVSGEGLDTYKQLTKVIPLTPDSFFKSIAREKYQIASSYRKTLLEMNSKAASASNEFIRTSSWSDLQAFDTIMQHIPSGYDVQMGNSSVVRYVLLSDSRKGLSYFGNRGVAGIDGCTSTAVGASFISKKPTVLITGDIGFFYDSNAFWNEMVSGNLKIIVVNNAGGGIFRIIPGPNTTGNALDKYFETTHERKAESMAGMYNLNYNAASDKDTLERSIEWLFKQEGCAILEVHTPRLENDKVQKSYFNYIKENK